MVLHHFFVQVVQFPNLGFIVPFQFTLHLLVHVGKRQCLFVVVVTKLVVELPDFVYVDLFDFE